MREQGTADLGTSVSGEYEQLSWANCKIMVTVCMSVCVCEVPLAHTRMVCKLLPHDFAIFSLPVPHQDTLLAYIYTLLNDTFSPPSFPKSDDKAKTQTQQEGTGVQECDPRLVS